MSNKTESESESESLTGPISYVINLKRREDRLAKFTEKYTEHGPDVSLVVIEAIDGSLGETSYDYISKDNDFNNEPRVIACAQSHIKTWINIIESNRPGFIFEDDVNFREDNLFKKNFTKLCKDINKLELNDNKHNIVYIGGGDILPIHTNIKSDSLLRAQEKTHIKEFINDSIGIPNFRSAYIFSWLGAFSYYLTPKTAKYLLNELEIEPMKTAVDVYLRNKFQNPYIVYPLLAYHDILETSSSDIVKRNRK